jgi:hypothetical protein
MNGYDLRKLVQSKDPIISWDSFEDCAHEDDSESNWEDLNEYLSDIMDAINPDNRDWHADVRNFGWQKINGWKQFKAKEGSQLLFAVLPKTDCSFNIRLKGTRKKGYEMVIQNFHHDNCDGSEHYYIKTKNAINYLK